MADWHWTARLTKAEVDVINLFSCSAEWMASFEDEAEVQNLEAEGAPMLNETSLDTQMLEEALQRLEENAYVWPLGDGRWCLDEYGLPIWLALKGRKSSCTIEYA
jgi:hypothetical protein